MNAHTALSGMLGFDPAALRSDLWIAGQWREGGGGAKLPVYNPSTGLEIARIGNASIEDGIDAVAVAHDALPGWAATPPRERSEILRRCYELMIERKDHLAALISLENGKALADATGEVVYAAEFFRWFAEECVRLNGELYSAPSGKHRIIVGHRPIGVAVMITPWNFPAAMATRKIAPALAAGCTCVVKPATETPLTAYALAELCAEAGVPAGVINVVTTERSGPVISAMLHDSRVRKLSFTGSTEVGRRLLREAADCVISCAMELGGNAPFIVFDDADLDAAIEGAMIAKMRNGGEACTAANRFLVQSGIAAEFSARFAARMTQLRVGPGYEATTQLGPLINAAAVERIEGLVRDAVDHGAKCVTGGKQIARDGYYFPATVLTDVPENASITTEEIFGPVAAISTFDTEDEAVQRANASEYGLVSYIYTGDLARGLRVSERMESGMVGLNRGVVSDPAAPFGGVKQSGLGREGAHHGMLEYCEVQYIAADW